MPFPSNGSNHVNGIKNEKNIVDYLNKHPDNHITKQYENKVSSKLVKFEHKGGPRQKKDATCTFENGICKGISIKKHEKGTFDWINSTPKKLGVSWSSELNDELADFKALNKNIEEIPKKEVLETNWLIYSTPI